MEKYRVELLLDDDRSYKRAHYYFETKEDAEAFARCYDDLYSTTGAGKVILKRRTKQGEYEIINFKK